MNYKIHYFLGKRFAAPRDKRVSGLFTSDDASFLHNYDLPDYGFK